MRVHPRKRFVDKALTAAYAAVPEIIAVDTGVVQPVMCPQGQTFWFSLSEGTSADITTHLWNNIDVPDSTLVDSQRVLLMKFKETYRMSNTTNAMLNIRAYHIRLRRDVQTTTWGVTDVLFTGWQNAGIPVTAGSGDTSDLYLTPFLSPQFCQYFKITRVQKKKVMPGKETFFSVHNNYGKLINYRQSQDWFRQSGIWRGILFAIDGQLTADYATHVPPITNYPGTTKTEMAVHYKDTWHYKYIAPYTHKVKFIPGTFLSTADLDHIVNPRLGEPEQYVGLDDSKAAGRPGDKEMGIIAHQNIQSATGSTVQLGAGSS